MPRTAPLTPIAALEAEVLSVTPQGIGDPLATVLVVDDEPDLCVLYQTALQRLGYLVFSAGTVEGAKLLLAQQPAIGCVVSDFRLPDGTGLELAHHIAQNHTGLPISIMTAYGSPEHAVQALKAGAFDYLTKPVAIADLRSTVANMLAVDPRMPNNSLTAITALIAHRLPGQSPAMKGIHQQLAQLAQTQACLVLQGESGTGKELAARALHAASQRAGGPFVVLNCGALDKTMIESAMFGTEQRNASGEVELSDGAFQMAKGGTLLLDDVGALPLDAQVRLLNALQERTIRRLGALKHEPIDTRILVSSSQSLPQLVAAGQFRQDLYYRLNVMVMNLPPLRDRQGDAVWLAQRWLAAHPQGKTMGLAPGAMAWLRTYSFAGNVRELENILERAVALSGAGVQSSAFIEVAHLQMPGSMETLSQANSSLTTQQHSATEPEYIGPERRKTMHGDPNRVAFPLDIQAHLAGIERIIIEQSLQRTRFNRTQAAALLGLNLRQLRYRIEQLGIDI